MAKRSPFYDVMRPSAPRDEAGSSQQTRSPVEPAETRPLQFRVSESVFAEFSEQAGREFAFTKGSKSQLFLKIWAEYRAKDNGASR